MYSSSSWFGIFYRSLSFTIRAVALVLPLPDPQVPEQHEKCCILCKKPPEWKLNSMHHIRCRLHHYYKPKADCLLLNRREWREKWQQIGLELNEQAGSDDSSWFSGTFPIFFDATTSQSCDFAVGYWTPSWSCQPLLTLVFNAINNDTTPTSDSFFPVNFRALHLSLILFYLLSWIVWCC